MIGQQRVSDQMMNAVRDYETPFVCPKCGFKTNFESALKYHKKDWIDIHKKLRTVNFSGS